MNKYLIIILVFLVKVAVSQNGQSSHEKGKPIGSPMAKDTLKGSSDTSGYVFTIAQHMPKFNGDLNKYLKDNIQYPDSEKKAKVQGTVYVNFIVEKDGSITHIKVLRTVPSAPRLAAEAVRVLAAMPKWTPGMQNEKLVRVSYQLPVHFQVDSK